MLKGGGQDPEIYLDFMLYGVIFAIIGARLYYVVFQWGYYKDHLAEIFNIRKGGLAIYGGIIAAVVTLIVFTRKRKLSFLSMADSACLGLVTGQIIGRWGNFVNCEAFGGYTDSLFAMRIKRSIVNESMISQELLENLITGKRDRSISRSTRRSFTNPCGTWGFFYLCSGTERERNLQEKCY